MAATDSWLILAVRAATIKSWGATVRTFLLPAVRLIVREPLQSDRDIAIEFSPKFRLQAYREPLAYPCVKLSRSKKCGQATYEVTFGSSNRRR